MKIEYADKQNQFFKEMKWWELIVGGKEVKCENENWKCWWAKSNLQRNEMMRGDCGDEEVKNEKLKIENADCAISIFVFLWIRQSA